MENILKKYRHIAITGTGPGVGTTFVATGLACYFAEMGLEVSYTECGNPCTKSHLPAYNLGDDLADLYLMAQEPKPLAGQHNFRKIEGACPQGEIDFRVITPSDRDLGTVLTKEEMLRLVSTARGDVCIFDVSSEDDFNYLLGDTDILLVVMDPMPSLVASQTDRIKELEAISRELRERKCHVKWIINRYNDGVSKRVLKNYIKERNLAYLEELPRGLIAGGEYRGDLPWRQQEIRAAFLELFTNI